jgi:hypothetical protein
MNAAIEKDDDLEIMELEIDLDQNLYHKANMEQVAHDRVRELKTWSKIKNELNDGSFDDEQVNTHQAQSLRLTLQNRVQALGSQSSPSEVMNAVGPLQTVERLTQDGKLLNFQEIKHRIGQGEQPK